MIVQNFRTIPKIHIVYYKRKIDMVHIYKHLSTYTSNRDYKIIIWMFSFQKMVLNLVKMLNLNYSMI